MTMIDITLCFFIYYSKANASCRRPQHTTHVTKTTNTCNQRSSSANLSRLWQNSQGRRCYGLWPPSIKSAPCPLAHQCVLGVAPVAVIVQRRLVFLKIIVLLTSLTGRLLGLYSAFRRVTCGSLENIIKHE